MFYDLMDEIMAEELGVDVETYINVIEDKCTLEEAEFIIDNILEEKDKEKARELFNSKLPI